jgi:hypothetical protein
MPGRKQLVAAGETREARWGGNWISGRFVSSLLQTQERSYFTFTVRLKISGLLSSAGWRPNLPLICDVPEVIARYLIR